MSLLLKEMFMISTYDEIATSVVENSGFGSDLLNMVLTIVSGVFVFIIGQLFIEYFLKPIQDYKKLRANIASALTYYADLYLNPVEKRCEEYDEGKRKIRELSAQVRATIEIKPLGNIFIPQKQKLAKAAEGLMGLSNCFYCKSNLQDRVEQSQKYCKKNMR